MTELALMWQALIAWAERIDAYSLVIGTILGALLSFCIVVAALLFGGRDIRPDDWQPVLTKWRRG